jgi:flagellin
MSSGIVLSAGVRQNLLSLQNTASLAAATENKLATGKKVNSALDNPQSFFTSQSLLNRSSDLGSLLDQIGQAQQTLQAANQGLTSLTSLVQSAKSLANQALQSPTGSVTYTGVTGTAAIAADTTNVTGTTTIATAGAASASTQSSSSLDVSALVAAGSTGNGQTLTVSLNGVSKTYTFANSGSGSAAGTFSDAASLKTAVATDFGTKATEGAVASNAFTLTSTDVTNNIATGGTATTGTGTQASVATTAASLGGAFTVSDGTHTQSFYFVAAGAVAANNTYSDATSLAASITASNVHTVGGANGVVTAANSSGNLTLSTVAGGQVTVGGSVGAAAGFAATTYSNNYSSSFAGVTGTLTVQSGTNAAHTITFGTGSGQVSSKSGLNTALASFSDVSGSINGQGNVSVVGTSTDAITIGGTSGALTATGLTAGSTTPTATVVTANSTRSNLQTQYNNLLTQIDQLASDSSYNGVNLLKGDSLKVTFNETNTSSLTISGVHFDSAGLGLSSVSGTGFQNNTNVNATVNSLNTALTSLRTQSAQFGSTLSTVQTRQDFTKNLVNVLQTGSDNLVLADSNQEGASLLALQTRQQLSTTALSLANQANQAVLRLFG